MTVPGLSHGLAGGRTHGHLSHGHLINSHLTPGHPTPGALHPAHGPAPGHGAHHASPTSHAPEGGAWLLALASPRVLLSLALGFGLSGLLLGPLLPALWRLPAAALGSVLFEGLLIRPYWSFLLRFEALPALSLASAAGGPARAATDFDRRGAGLVTFELNGETRQMLAHLEGGVPARQGEALTIERIDEASNRCTVRRP